MSCRVAAILLPAVLAGWQIAQTAPRTPSPKEIDRAVEQLGDEEFLVRQRASKFLWEAGQAAEAALTRAAGSSDPEVAVRARRILRSFKYGIYPDTPEEVVLLIERFRQGNPDSKLAAMRQLMDRAAVPTLLKLLRTVTDETLRQRLAQSLAKDIDKLAGAMFIVGQWDKAEQFLEIGAVTESGMRNYAAYYLLRGGLDAKIAALSDRVARAPTALDAQLLAYLRRARGDLAGALAAAEKANQPALLDGILIELGQWQRLAQSYDQQGRDATGQPAGGIVHLGYTAAFHRLAGNSEKFEEAVDAIKELARRKPNKIWYCGVRGSRRRDQGTCPAKTQQDLVLRRGPVDQPAVPRRRGADPGRTARNRDRDPLPPVPLPRGVEAGRDRRPARPLCALVRGAAIRSGNRIGRSQAAVWPGAERGVVAVSARRTREGPAAVGRTGPSGRTSRCGRSARRNSGSD